MIRATLATLAWGIFLGAASAAPSDVEVPSAYRTAAPWARGAALMGDLSEGRYEGRRLFRRAGELVLAPSDRVAFWLGESETTVFGRSSDSRLRLHADHQALRWRVGSLRDGSGRGTEFALQADRFGTTDAVATTSGGGTATRSVYAATRFYAGGLVATRGPLDAALSVGFADTKGEDARTLSASVGYRLPVAKGLTLWGQGTLVGQDEGGGLRPVVRGQLRYAPSAWTTVALEGVAFLRGVPADDPLGSFLLYNPGGSAASGLQTGVLGYGALRLSVGFRF